MHVTRWKLGRLLALASAALVLLLLGYLAATGLQQPGPESAEASRGPASAGEPADRTDATAAAASTGKPRHQGTVEPCLAAALGKAESVTITRLRTAKVRSVHLYRHGVFVLHLEGGGKAMFKPLPHDPFEMHAAPQFNELVATHIAFNLGMDNAPLSAIRNAPLHSLRDAISDNMRFSEAEKEEAMNLLNRNAWVGPKGGNLVTGIVIEWLAALHDVSRRHDRDGIALPLRNMPVAFAAAVSGSDPALARSLPQLMDLLVLDYLQGQDDRSHNVFVQCAEDGSRANLDRAHQSTGGSDSLLGVLRDDCRLVAVDNQNSFPRWETSPPWVPCREVRPSRAPQSVDVANVDPTFYYHPIVRHGLLLGGDCSLWKHPRYRTLASRLDGIAAAVGRSLACHPEYRSLLDQRKFIQECDFRMLEVRDRATHLLRRLGACGVEADGPGPADGRQPTPAAFRAVAGYKTLYRVDRAGEGRAVRSGDTVTVHAKGVVAESGEKFWSTRDAGQAPFTYRAGVGGVITGWDQGCLGMRLGEVRTLRIPAAEGYGATGFPSWGIPGGATLEFTLECVSIV